MDAFCGRASGYSKVSFVLLFSALGLQCAGLGTIAWMKTKLVSNNVYLVIGLWKISNCNGSHNTPCEESELPGYYKTHLLDVTRTFEILCMVAIIFALVLSFFYVTSYSVRILKTATVILALGFLAVLLYIGGTITWAQNLPDNHYVYWSVGLTTISATLCFIAGILMIPDIRNYDYDGIDRKIAEKRERKRKKQLEGKETIVNSENI